MEDGHRNSGFFHSTQWFSIVLNYQRLVPFWPHRLFFLGNSRVDVWKVGKNHAQMPFPWVWKTNPLHFPQNGPSYVSTSSITMVRIWALIFPMVYWFLLLERMKYMLRFGSSHYQDPSFPCIPVFTHQALRRNQLLSIDPSSWCRLHHIKSHYSPMNSYWFPLKFARFCPMKPMNSYFFPSNIDHFLPQKNMTGWWFGPL